MASVKLFLLLHWFPEKSTYKTERLGTTVMDTVKGIVSSKFLEAETRVGSSRAFESIVVRDGVDRRLCFLPHREVLRERTPPLDEHERDLGGQDERLTFMAHSLWNREKSRHISRMSPTF